jgi:transcriptional regulator with XRE-family HTH domain
MSVNPFAAYFSQLRLQQRLTLRQFCSDNAFDPGNVSKMERGLTSPPKDNKVLARYALALGLKKNTAEWNKFFALAATATGKIPEKLMTDKEVLSQLPVLFMALGKKKPSAARLKQIIKLVKES